MAAYTDLGYPQTLTVPKLVPDFEAHFTDPASLSGVNSALSGIFDGGLSPVTNSGVQTVLSIENVAISGIDASGNIVNVGSGAISFLRPQYDFTANLNKYRVSGLSNAHTSFSQDLLFNKYIHYIANAAGGQGLLDTTPFATQRDITYSRNMASGIATYSRYS